MDSQTNKTTEHQLNELRFLFKHLLVFLIGGAGLRILNMIFIPMVSWSQFFIIIWTILLAFHLVLFFMTTGMLGEQYEGRPVKEIAYNILDIIKSRNKTFKNSFQRDKKTPSAVN